ncbi:MAG: hypothetical protein ACI4XL_10905 [Bacillus sp. (in: firmicutes)]
MGRRSEEEIRSEVRRELESEYEYRDTNPFSFGAIVFLFVEIFGLSWIISTIMDWGLAGTLIMGFIGLGLLSSSKFQIPMVFFLSSLWGVAMYFYATSKGGPSPFIATFGVFAVALFIHFFAIAASED